MNRSHAPLVNAGLLGQWSTRAPDRAIDLIKQPLQNARRQIQCDNIFVWGLTMLDSGSFVGKLVLRQIAISAAIVSLIGCREDSVVPDPTPASCIQIRQQGGLSVTNEGKIGSFFRVVDCNEKALPETLKKEDFSLEEGGGPLSSESKHYIGSNQQKFRSYAVLLLDTSQSVYGELSNVAKGADAFVDSLFSAAQVSRNKGSTFVAVYAFDGLQDIKELAPPSDDPVLLKQKIALINSRESCVANGFCRHTSTNLNGGVIAGINKLDTYKNTATSLGISIVEGTLVVFTDGGDNAGWSTTLQATSKVSSSTHSVFSVGVRGQDLDEPSLQSIGKSGFVFTENFAGLASKFQEIAKRVEDISNSYYLLQYCTPRLQGTNIELKVTAKYGGASNSFNQKFSVNNPGGAKCNADPASEQQQPPVYSPGQSMGAAAFGSANDEPNSGAPVAVDSTGAVYVGTAFDYRIDMRTGAGHSDAQIKKMSGMGLAPIWTRTLDGTAHMDIAGLIVDSSDNVIVSGAFNGSVDFGAGQTNTTGFGIRLFVAKYSGGDGTLLWVRHFEGDIFPHALSLSLDSGGAIQVVGIMDGSMNFGGGVRSSTGLKLFLARYGTADGAHLGDALTTPYSSLGTQSGMYFAKVIADPGNSVYALGFFSGTVNLSSTNRLVSNGSAYDGYVVRYGSGGAVLWGTAVGATINNDNLRAAAIDSGGNLIVGGQSDATLDVVSGRMTSGKALIAKVHLASGAIAWQKNLTSPVPDRVADTFGVAVDGDGSALATGYLNELFGTNASDEYFGATVGDVFVAKLNGGDGAQSWMKSFSTATGPAYGTNVAADKTSGNVNSGSIVVSGMFTNTIDFGSGTGAYTSAGKSDGFVFRLRQ